MDSNWWTSQEPIRATLPSTTLEQSCSMWQTRRQIQAEVKKKTSSDARLVIFDRVDNRLRLYRNER